MSPAATVPALVMRRTYTVSPERLYEAWTEPKLATQFLCPEGMSVPEATFDALAGGSYRIVMRRPDGEDYVAFGVYRVVEPGRRLVMTWSWEEDDPSQQHETLLTVEFLQHEKGSELVLTQEQFASVESRDSHEHGWTSIIERLDGLS
jgi:uncharacterized protein YndB with AHSA1/START domain